MYHDGRPALADESPAAHEDLRVIGVELAVATPGYSEEELEMFAVKHTLRGIAGPRNSGGGPPRQPVCFRVTLHTNQGDLTAYLSSAGGGRVGSFPVW